MLVTGRKLPIGIQTFEDIRNDGYLYVDKTALMWTIANIGKPFFLSRPRRFGKSLLISTFEAYFKGRRELFTGLAVEELEKKWEEHPVLHLDLNARKYSTPADLDAILNQHLERWEAVYGEEKRDRASEERFAYVIRRASEQTGKGVVVLVDEYDKPLLQAIQNEPLLESYRSTLKAFYGVLKSADRYLRFAFLTGVTKFSQVSVFSDLNQLNDISMNYDFSTLCGITHEELLSNFEPELMALSRANGMNVEEVVDAMTRQYDGYHFHPNGEGVFNPFSVLNAFFSKEFGNYWFQTGTPTFLVELLKESDYDLRLLMDGIETAASAFTEYRADRKNPIPLIYQSGYLTIKEYDREFGLYRLGFPNDEVRYGFLNFLVPFYTAVTDEERSFYVGKFVQELRSGDVDAFMHRFEAFFADFPYELNDRTERHYQVVIYLIFKLMGQFTQAEVHSSRGRADAVVKTPKFVYVFEFKLKGTAGQALQQIEEKGYTLPYVAEGRQVIKVGVEFSAEKRNVERWMVEEEK
ncbi:ATP-binding protein [Bacteroides finegoldii]|uniref:ATP-binding protein n=1 Tax=Bacteroides finegoldii TaxID=338188 RepID=UPI00189EC909|nr:ATP-binding protein [Bacteroides finegoldii]